MAMAPDQHIGCVYIAVRLRAINPAPQTWRGIHLASSREAGLTTSLQVTSDATGNGDGAEEGSAVLQPYGERSQALVAALGRLVHGKRLAVTLHPVPQHQEHQTQQRQGQEEQQQQQQAACDLAPPHAGCAAATAGMGQGPSAQGQGQAEGEAALGSGSAGGGGPSGAHAVPAAAASGAGTGACGSAAPPPRATSSSPGARRGTPRLSPFVRVALDVAGSPTSPHTGPPSEHTAPFGHAAPRSAFPAPGLAAPGATAGHADAAAGEPPPGPGPGPGAPPAGAAFLPAGEAAVALPGGVVLLAAKVHLPLRVWLSEHHAAHWAGSEHRAAAVLLNALVPLGSSREQVAAMQRLLLQPPLTKEQCSVMACLRELPTIMQQQRQQQQPARAQLPLPGSEGPTTSTTSTSGAGPSAGAPPLLLPDLPVDVVLLVMCRLAPLDLARLCCTCSQLRDVGAEAVPSVSLTLFPHQRAAIRWMLGRERVARPPPPHPLVACMHSHEGLALWADLVTGQLRTEQPAPPAQLRGGFFCDEPGLGKTITALSVILKTQGTLPEPPPACAASLTVARNAAGRRTAYYTMTRMQQQQGLAAAAAGSGDAPAPAAAAVAAGALPQEQDGAALPTPATRRRSSGRVPAVVPTRWSRRAMAALAEGLHKADLARRSREEKEALEAAKEEAAAAAAGLGPSPPGKSPRKRRASAAAGGRGGRAQRRRRASREEAGGDGEPAAVSPAASWGGKGGRGCKQQQQQHQPGEEYDDEGQHQRQMEGEGGGETWVECSGCSKWRLVPAGSLQGVVGEADAWFCHMHPDAEYASCNAPLQPYADDQRFEQCPGYVCADEAEEREDNVTFFNAVMAQHSAMLRANPGALLQVLRTPVDELLPAGSGVVMVRELVRNLAGYEPLMRRLELRTREELGIGGRGRRQQQQQQQRGRARGGAGDGGKRRSADGPGAYRMEAHTWHQPPYLEGLRLDTWALAKALDQELGGTAAARVAATSVRVYLSPATLVVVPAPLIDHWQSQIRTHIVSRTLRLCVLDHYFPARGTLSAGAAASALPSVSSLAWDYDIVLTTFERLSAMGGDVAAVAAGSGACGGGGGSGNTVLCSRLLQVHWLRIILDEGHLLTGANAAQVTNKLAMARAIKAERRWVMTGTPTPATASSNALHLQPLLDFLGHRPYTVASVWGAAVRRPLRARQPEGRARLMELLTSTMIRASKADLLLLPPLKRSVVVLDFDPQHAHSYNELVEVVRRNLLTSDWFDEDHRQSLMNGAQSRWSNEMMRNVRLACCVAGSTNPVVKEEDLAETLGLLAERLGHQPPRPHGPPWLAGDHPLAAVEEGLRHGTGCMVCGCFTRQPMVTPCAHLLCVGCAAIDREACPVDGCATRYHMQGVDDPERLAQNKSPKWPVPQELIEWQPVYHQHGAEGVEGGHWHDEWEQTRSTKVAWLMARLREIRALPVPVHADPHGQGDGSHHHDESPPALRARHHHGRGGLAGVCCGPALQPPKVKALVFSQFTLHLWLVRSHLRASHIPFALISKDMVAAERNENLSRFRHDPMVGVMLMDKCGAVGLDLSFVSHVVLLEPLEDRALEQQVVSRAHRMGARSAVHVETLVMRGTVEEHTLRLAGGGGMEPHHNHQHQGPAPGPGPGAPAAAADDVDDAAAGPQQQQGDDGGEGGNGGGAADGAALRNQLYRLLETVRAAAGQGAAALRELEEAQQLLHGRGGGGSSSEDDDDADGGDAGRGVAAAGGLHAPALPAATALHAHVQAHVHWPAAEVEEAVEMEVEAEASTEPEAAPGLGGGDGPAAAGGPFHGLLQVAAPAAVADGQQLLEAAGCSVAGGPLAHTQRAGTGADDVPVAAAQAAHGGAPTCPAAPAGEAGGSGQQHNTAPEQRQQQQQLNPGPAAAPPQRKRVRFE